MYKTYQPKAKEVKRVWHLLDAKDNVLGRLSVEVARYLMGKHKSTYSEHMDSGDYVVVVNAKDVRVTGKKSSQKLYISHSGYPGGYKEVKYEKLAQENPAKIIVHAVTGMLPDNRLKKARLARLKVFSGSTHKYNDKFTKNKSE